jgi:hypothetical protein
MYPTAGNGNECRKKAMATAAAVAAATHNVQTIKHKSKTTLKVPQSDLKSRKSIIPAEFKHIIKRRNESHALPSTDAPSKSMR